jgi:hypothetical protein
MSESSSSASTTGATGAATASTGDGAATSAQSQQAADTTVTASDATGELQPEKAPEAPEKSEPMQPEKAEETKPEEPAEETTEKPKHKFHERLLKAFPDRKYESDDDYDTALTEHLDALEGYKERGTKANERLINVMDSEPAVGAMLRDMIQGATFRQALARHFDAADFEAQEGDPDFEGWAQNAKERETALKKRREFEKTYAENLKNAESEIETWAKEAGHDEKTMAALFDQIDGVLDEFNSGKITKDLLVKMQRIFTYDKDIEKAREEGRIAGRNENITAKKDKQPDNQGDGIPRPGKTASTKEETPESPTAEYFKGLRDRMASRGIIE